MEENNTAPPEISHSDNDSTDGITGFPHWSILALTLVLFVAIIAVWRSFFHPVILSLATVYLLYPWRKNKYILPLLILASLVALSAIWIEFNQIITPFIIAFILAYAFDPLVAWLSSRGLPRWTVVLLMLLLLFLLICGVGLLVIPRLIKEMSDLISTLPAWFGQPHQWGKGSLESLLTRFGVSENILQEVRSNLPQILKDTFGGFTEWATEALTSVTGMLAGLANIVLIPILTVYFLTEFRKIRSGVYSLIPEDSKPKALITYHRLNDVISAYIRGQLLVVLFLAIWIGLGLQLFTNIPYALLIGISAGILNLLPYVGTAAALLITLIIAAFQPDAFITCAKALAIFVSAQTLEGNLLTPKIVGDRVGLHALLVIFVVLIFASMFGLVGMLIAIPLSASAKVIIEIMWSNKKLAD